jgi:hypothetical protein
VSVARWLNVAALWLTTVLLGFGLLRLTRSLPNTIGFTLTFLSIPATLWYSASVMAEPLSLLLGSATIVWLVIYLRRGGWIHLVGSGACAGLAAATRLPWLALVPAGMLGLLLFARGGRGRRLERASAFAALAVLPTLLWLSWLSRQGGAAGPRQWAWPDGNLWYLLNEFRIRLVAAMWDWLPLSDILPTPDYRTRLGLIGLMFVIGAIAAVLAFRRIAQGRSTAWNRLSLAPAVVVPTAGALSYLALLVITWLFMVPRLTAADLDERILHPLQIGQIYLGFLLLYLLGEAYGQGRLAGAASLILAGAFVWGPGSASWARAARLAAQPSEYAGASDSDSSVISWLVDFPSDRSLISNESAAILFQLNRPAFDVPELVSDQEVEFKPFGAGTSPVEGIFRDCNAALILFFDSAFDDFLAVYDEQAIPRMISFMDGLTPVYYAADAVVFVYDDPARPGMTCGDLRDRLLSR